MERLVRLAERLRRDGFVVAADSLWIFALAAAAATMLWSAIAPLPAYTSAQTLQTTRRDVSEDSMDDPFIRGASPGAVVSDASGFSLQAVRTGAETGSAIITAPGGAQRLVALGEEAAPGWRLVMIASDRVFLEGPSGRVSVSFPSTPVLAQTPARPDVSGFAFSGLRLTPAEASDGSPALRLDLSGSASELNGSGLRDGDILTRIGPTEASSLVLADLQQALLSETPVEVRFERAGQAMITHTLRNRP